MRRSFLIFLLLAAAPMLMPLPALAEMRPLTASGALGTATPSPEGIVLIGGTGGGMTGGGMSAGAMNGGMGAAGMGGMGPAGMGGMGPGGMGGMTGGMGGAAAGAGAGGTGGGPPAYSASPAGGTGQSYGGDATTNGSPAAHYQCVTQQGHCSVEATAGALRHGASCTCLLGGPGKIK
jgi:hypothetical protein